ncbi:MAG: glycosyltransferase [Saprospiraceae bacterium]
MDLSVVILNYNVRYLLESCIQSVQNAIIDLSAEIILVDNASTDESVKMVKELFPSVVIKENATNLGFAKANNLGVLHASGDYILILNPDTIINKEAIQACLGFLKENAHVGVTGVKMLDGNGKYLRESARGFPDLWSSVSKFIGLGKLFPKSDFFNHYYLADRGHANRIEVEVLTGAFMILSKQDYLDMGGFDEDFFMYGEDIDFCRRMRKQNKKLFCLCDQQIIHLKGRSSRFDSYQHVRNFYEAMSIFVKKNYPNPFSKFIIQIAIGLVAFFSLVKRKFIAHILPVTDIITIALIIYLVQSFWARYWFHQPDYFDNKVFLWNAIGSAIVWFSSLVFFDTYDAIRENQPQNTFQSVWIGTVVILIVYSLMPEHLRSSRAVLLISSVIASFVLLFMRKLLLVNIKGVRALFWSEENTLTNFNSLFKELTYSNYIAYLNKSTTSFYSTDFDSLKSQIIHEKITHLVIVPEQLSFSQILYLNQELKGKVKFLNIEKSEPGNTLYKIVNGEMGLFHFRNKAVKWLVNTLASIFLLPFGWLSHPIRKNFTRLLTGKLYWVGYESPEDNLLPYKKQGLWSPREFYNITMPAAALNFEYAKNYNPYLDIRIILNHLF